MGPAELAVAMAAQRRGQMLADHGLLECETCLSWIRPTKLARQYHDLNACKGPPRTEEVR